jgi:hypothetical protein
MFRILDDVNMEREKDEGFFCLGQMLINTDHIVRVFENEYETNDGDIYDSSIILVNGDLLKVDMRLTELVKILCGTKL